MGLAQVVDPVAAVVAIIGVAGIASTTVDTVLKHRRKQRTPGRLLAERFAEGQLSETDYVRALELISHTNREGEWVD